MFEFDFLNFKEKKLVDLNDKILKESDKDNYINVKTGRPIVVLNKPGFKYYLVSKNYICGNDEDIDEFIQKNKLSTKKLVEQTFIQKTLVEKKVKETIKLASPKIDGPVCDINSAGSALYLPENNDIESIPNEILDTMCPFELTGLKVKAKIVKIKDADTIDIAFFVNFSELAKPREKGTKNHKKMKVPILTKHLNADYCMVYSSRIYGIDAAEHDTAQGQLATLLLKNYLESINNIVYVKIIEYEKYGRLMIEYYSDSKMKNNIGEKLLNIHVTEFPDIIREGVKSGKINVNSKKNTLVEYDKNNQDFLTLSYFGETKSDIFQNYYKVDKNFINVGDHGNLLNKYRLR